MPSPEKPWPPLELIKTSAAYLAEKGVPTPRLDAELLLCHVMQLASRIELFARFERTVRPDELARFRALIARRAKREPVARILGRREFMSLDFAVTPAVLSPRPETELLVEQAVTLIRPPPSVNEDVPPDHDGDDVPPPPDPTEDEALHRLLDAYAEGGDEDEEPDDPPPPVDPARDARRTSTYSYEYNDSPVAVAVPATASVLESRRTSSPRGRAGRATSTKTLLDLGTGSGCVAIAVLALCPGARAVGVDISADALRVAADNARRRGVADRLTLRQGDWWDALAPDEQFDVVVSNPPYLVEGDPAIWPEARDFDPPVALYGGVDGLDAYRRIAGQLAARLRPGGAALFEIGADQAEDVQALLRDALPDRSIRVLRDNAGLDRVVMAY